MRFVLRVNENNEHKKSAIAILDEELSYLNRYVGVKVENGIEFKVLLYLSNVYNEPDIKRIWVSDELYFKDLRKVVGDGGIMFGGTRNGFKSKNSFEIRNNLGIRNGIESRETITFNLENNRSCGLFLKDLTIFLTDCAIDVVEFRKNITLSYVNRE